MQIKICISTSGYCFKIVSSSSITVSTYSGDLCPDALPERGDVKASRLGVQVPHPDHGIAHSQGNPT